MTKKTLSEAGKIACLKCDEVSTSKAWEKNHGTCPKCKNSNQGVAESQLNENDIVNFSSYAGMYSDGAHAVFKGRNGKTYKIAATGDTPRKYFVNGKEVSWDQLKKLAGRAKIHPRQGMDEDVGMSDKERNPEMDRELRRGNKRPQSAEDKLAARIAQDKANGMTMDPSDIAKRRKVRAQFGESAEMKKRGLTEGVLDDMDDDGFLAKRQLYDLAKYSVMLHKMIQDTDNLEPWIQAKITKAADYIDTVKHYLEYSGVRDAEATADVMAPDIADIDAIDSQVDSLAPQEEVMEYGDEDEGSELGGWDILRMAKTRGIISPEAYDSPPDDLYNEADYFADDLGPQFEIGSSDVSIWMKQFARDLSDKGIPLDGHNAHIYINESKATDIYKKMTKGLRGKK